MAALKGIGWSRKTELGGKQLSALKVDWYYNWGSRYSYTPNNFIPMVWGGGDVPGNVQKIKSQLSTTDTLNVLGFNEPDLSGQALMSVDKALSLWPQIEDLDLRLGSPSTISWNRPWMNDFMTKAKKRGLRIDFLTMHAYGWPNAQSLLDKVDMFHEKWNLPVWITEYGVADWAASADKPNKYSVAETLEFMEETVTGFHARPHVERFAWKTRFRPDYVMRPGHLFHSNGSLTSAGKLYSCL